jgi:EAL domain-containing protein (putative c-di-GMP-specific phosphodiesterase class I)
LQVSGSIGATFYPQNEDIDADQLLRQADQAMYQAKLAGKNRRHLFDADLDNDMRQRHEMRQRIARALENSEFELYYQPKVQMRTGQVVGAEALIRWNHPEDGLRSPAHFLPDISDHALELEISRWVMGQAMQQVQAWQEQGLALPVSVNIPGQHLQHPDFVSDLKQILGRFPGVPEGFLELEVLESSALEDIHRISEVIEQCTALGVSVALDDFGTGYSSLTYLRRLPAQTLKIDQTFVRDMLSDPDDLAILEGVLGLARAFQREAIAEGVETEGHGQMLLQLGCELGQGYGIARPMPAQAIPSWVASWKPSNRWSQTHRAEGAMLELLYAGVEHHAWMDQLESYLYGERQTAPNLESTDNRLGQWLTQHSYAFETHGQAGQLNTLHEKMHTLAKELVSNHLNQRHDAAKACMGELRQFSQQALETLQGLVHRSPA